MALPPRLRSGLFGERGLRFELAATPAVLARAAAALAASDGTLDAAGGTRSIVVVAAAPIDPMRRAELTTAVAAAVADASRGGSRVEVQHEIAVVYDGPDLGEVAAAAGLTTTAAAELHAEPEYVVELGGFLPGFAYLGEVPARLRRPRRGQPRARVGAGAVGIAGHQTGIYPSASPGGWNLVARALLEVPLFDPTIHPPARFAVGDRVRFRPIAASDAPPEPIGSPAQPGAELGGAHEAEAALVVDRVAALITIQDGGRARWLLYGVPASGAVDPVALAAANLAVGNDPAAAGIEIAAGAARFVARRDVLASIDGEPARRFLAGDTISVSASLRLASYLAVRGGIAIAEVLGSRSTAVAASLGGFCGRPLRRGDALAASADPGTPLPDRPRLIVPAVAAETVLRVDVLPPSGPLDAASVGALLERTFTVSSRLDRVGVRLEGGPVPRSEDGDARAEPVIPGVVQIASDGTPMVLGPDAAVTGGYPVIGVLRKTSLWALYRLRPGARVRFARPASS